MTDVVKIARERRSEMTEKIAELNAEIARIDEFMEMADNLVAGKPAASGKSEKVTELGSNIFSKPSEAATG